MLQQLVEGRGARRRRARLLVQRLLSFARRQHLRPRPIDVASWCWRTAELMLRSLCPRIQLDLRVAEGLAPQLVDPTSSSWRCSTSAVNARDAMDGDGYALDPRPGRRRPGGRPDRARIPAHLPFADTGCGMDAETLKRATEPFFTTKEIGRGTGLGLSSVHGLSLQSGGGFALESAPGRGTVATLWLPATNEPGGTVPEDLPGDSPPLAARSAMVLLVDDEPLVRAGSRHMLGEAGHAVVEAASAVEALQLLRAGLRVDILVTDYAMPGMSGSRLAEAARHLQPGLPVLLVTGYANLDDAEAERLPRLAKPYSAAGLAHAVAKLLS
jgi:CheY-like chemotaxis protein